MGPAGEPARMFGAEAAGPSLPWDWARQRLLIARTYWLTVVLHDGAPHSRPLWGVWRTEGLWLSTANRAVGAIARNPAVTAHTGDGERVVLVEGQAERVRDPVAVSAMLVEYNQKYDWEAWATADGMADSHGAVGAILVVRPTRVFGWDADDLARATRWPTGPDVTW